MNSFSADITTFVRKTKTNGALVVKKLAFDGLRGVIQKSPVDTGRFRASWRVGVNTVDLSTASAKERNAKGQFTGGSKAFGDPTATEAAKLEGIAWGASVSVTNNVVYGPALENGHSKQAPQGMLKLTFEELKASFARTVQAVVGGSGGGGNP